MKEFLKKYYRPILLPVLILATVLMFLLSGFSLVRRITTPGQFQLLEKETIPIGKIQSIAEDEDNVYLFYDFTGIINVYRKDGSYLYGLQIQGGNNGVGYLSIVDGKLTAETKSHVFYTFNGKKLVDVVEYTAESGGSYRDAHEQLVAAKATAQPYQYQLKNGGFTLQKLDAKGRGYAVDFLPRTMLLMVLLPAASVLSLLDTLRWLATRRRMKKEEQE